MTLNYIDLFAGSGALSEGFRLLGFHPVAHIEKDPNAYRTLQTRNVYHCLKENDCLSLYYNYICGKTTREKLYQQIPDELHNSVICKEISEESIKEIFNSVRKSLKICRHHGIDLIVGGPPCQPFSLFGRNTIDFENDKRLRLYIQYGKFLREFRPKVFVFENVPGLLSAGNGKYLANMKKYFKSIGYYMDYQVLNARDYGVLQDRKRVIIIGWQDDLPFSFPDIPHTIHAFTTHDILADVVSLQPGQSVLCRKYRRGAVPYLEQFCLQNEAGFYTQHIARPHNLNDLRIYRLALEKWNTEKNRLKYIDVPKKWRTQKNVTSFRDRFKVVDGNGISHTIVAHIAQDGHYYIHPDIAQCRSISVREAARIQSFPDDYYFEGERSSMFRQIGNAVPVLFSFAIANAIKKMLY
jgi:DNA (cytosine-5)-methyltransferase 1